MASIRKRLSKWQAQVRRKGFPAQIKSFAKREDAVRWARQQELSLDLGAIDQSSKFKDVTLATLLDRYQSEITPTKRSCISQTFHIRQIKRHFISKIPVLKIKSEQIARFRDDRLSEVSQATVRKELILLGCIFGLAIREWGFDRLDNPVRIVKKPPNGRARDRRLCADEMARFLAVLQQSRNPIFTAVVLFAKETGMRRSEILSLRWGGVNLSDKTAFLPITKNGLSRRVPLSPMAIEIIDKIKPKNIKDCTNNLIFMIEANAVQLGFERIRRRANIANFRFHDLRHEAISRFFEIGLSIAEVSMISGHKDPRMLFRYTHLKPENIAEKLRLIGK